MKNKGGLYTPSRSTFEIVLQAEKVYLTEIGENKLPSTPNLFHHLTQKVLRLVDVHSLFPTLSDHLLEQNPVAEEVHNITLVKLVAYRYLKIRCLNYTNVYNQRLSATTSTRNKTQKIRQFKRL